MSAAIRFLLGHELIEWADFDPQLTVLEWLRCEARRRGSKEGCAEGDCGACTVVVGELRGDRVRYRAMNACILLLATLDGKQLITVEDLAEGEVLHPVQQALVNHHGSQCGFCTPGFVMSLFAMSHQDGRSVPPGRQEIDQGLAGNLCRCTGYAPIIKAARDGLAQANEDQFDSKRVQTVAALQSIQPESALHIECNGRRFLAPRSIAQLCKFLDQHPAAVMVAGATDVGLWITKQLKQIDTLIYTCAVPELQEISVDHEQGCLAIGAAVTYSDALGTLTAHYPEIGPLLSRLGAVQVRNAGTIGGNIANGSPIGDMPPPLIALAARIVLCSQRGRREMKLEDFFIEYGRQDLQPGEFLEKIILPLAAEPAQFRVYKLSKRFDQDISSVCAAFSLSIIEGRVGAIRICFGGMAGVPARAKRTEKALLGQHWSDETIMLARTALDEDFRALSDWRASSQYRTLAAHNLLQRFYLETTSDESVQLAAGGSS